VWFTPFSRFSLFRGPGKGVSWRYTFKERCTSNQIRRKVQTTP
jgi:hypothetical protein